MSRPNVLLIVLDTLRRDRLSAYGYPRDTSPAFDAFSTRATLFERAVSPAQWTVPAHASLFTGLYPSQHGLVQGSQKLSGMHPTLAEILRADGYHTVAFCNNPLVSVLEHDLQRGFDHFYHYSSAIPYSPRDLTRQGARADFIRWFRPHARRIANWFAQSDELFRLSLHPFWVNIWKDALHFKGDTERSISELIDYWDAHHAGGAQQPLFAFVNLMGAHLPYRPPQPFLDKIAPELRRDSAAYAFMNRFNNDAAAWASPNDPPLADWQHHAIDAFYDAEIAAQDAQLGRLLRYLDESGALDDTCVFIVADHGESHGDHGLFGHGFVVHQELVHVPLLVYGRDRFPAGLRVPTNLSTRRIFHTILDIAGITPPLDEADPNADVEGLSVYQAVNGTRSPEHNLAFSEAVPPSTFLHVLRHRNPASIERLRLRQTRRGIYAGDDKLTVVGDNEIEALFDVANDPTETHDASNERPGQTTALHAAMGAFIASVEAGDGGSEGFGAVSPEVEEQLRALGYIE
jgi:arylsulfatase A-like enzyme